MIKLKTALRLGTLFTLSLGVVACMALLFGFIRLVDISAFHMVVLGASLLGVLVLLMAGFLYGIGSILTNRIAQLERAAQVVSGGNLEHRVALTGEDEVAQVSRVFNEMTENLKGYVTLIDAHARLQREHQMIQEAAEGLRRHNVEISDTLQRFGRAQAQFSDYERLQMAGQFIPELCRRLEEALQPVAVAAEHLEQKGGGSEGDPRFESALFRRAIEQARQAIQRIEQFREKPARTAIERLQIVDVIEEALAVTSPRWRDATARKTAPIQIVRQYESVPDIQGVRLALTQLFRHLICNAVDAMAGGGTLTFQARSNGPNWLTITVTDTGVGMTESVCKRCFLPFFSTRDGSSGIGLTLAQSIVLQHNGKIGLRSHPGVGTAVFIELPAAVSSGEFRGDAQESRPVDPMQILVVDDEAWTRDVIVALLRSDGHAVEEAASGLEALEKLRTLDFAALISDMAMPDMSGDELALEARQIKNSLSVILMTGYGALMKERGEKPAGVDLVLPKPIRMDDVRAALAAVRRPVLN